MKAVARNTMNWIVRSRYRHALLECLRIGSRHTIRSEDQTMQALSGNAKNNLILSCSARQREATSVPSRWMDPARQMNLLGAYRRKDDTRNLPSRMLFLLTLPQLWTKSSTRCVELHLEARLLRAQTITASPRVCQMRVRESVTFARPPVGCSWRQGCVPKWSRLEKTATDKDTCSG